MSTFKNNENEENAWLWREDDDINKKDRSAAKSRPRLSEGLDPARFHREERRGAKPGQARIEQMRITMRHERIAERKRQVIQEQDLRRSAFRSVTELKTWGTQQQAFEHFAALQREYLGRGKHAKDETAQNTNLEKGDAPGGTQESDNSSSSCSSAQTTSTQASQGTEAKRQLTDRSRSPAKSTRKQQYCEEFLRELNAEGPLDLDFNTHNALWSMEPRIWSIEKSSTGKRKYIVGHTGRLMDRYWRRVDRDQRHYYELIPAGKACRLYLDLEYSKITNPEIECAEELLMELLQDLSEELQRVFPEQVARPITRQDVIDLDATTEKKFSRHWILHLPGGHLFRDTAVMGRFVQNWIGRLADDHSTRRLGAQHALLQKHLFVNPAPSKSSVPATVRPTCILDLGVYTRNRLFRLMGSNKFGKPTDAILRIADANEFPLVSEGSFGNHVFYGPAMTPTQEQSGTSQSPAKTFDDAVEKAVKGFESSIDWTFHAEALAKTLVVPLNASKMDFPVLPFDEELVGEDEKNKTDVTEQHARLIGPRPYTSIFNGPSPYSAIDAFVLNVLGTRKGLRGAIRAWSVEKSDDNRPISITFQMSGNRWCECIQRSHKSNNIYWVVDLVLWHCVQRCHDPDCRALSFRGTPVPLPDDVREMVQQELLDEELAKLDEAVLLGSKVSTTKGLTLEKKNHSSEDEYEVDSDFEAALMTLNLGAPLKKPTKDNASSAAKSRSKSSSHESKSVDSESVDGDVSDSVFLQVMMDKPDLFS